MPLFEYSGRNRRGEPVSGQMEGLGIDAVADQLFNNGITPIDILPAGAQGDVFGSLRAWRLRFSEQKVQLVDLIFFSRQMYTLLKSGVPILQALRGLRDTSQSPALIRVIGSVLDSLDAGLDLTSALRRHPDVFSPLFVSMVQVGETTGGLPEGFLQLSNYLEREQVTLDRIKSALRYPMFVVLAIVIAMFILNIFVIPAFAKVYAGFHSQLPLPTRILIGVAEFTSAYWYLILAAMAAAVFGFLSWIKTPEGRYRWDRERIRLPIVGSVLYRASLGRFASALAITVKAGVPLVQGMTVISKAVDNEYLGERILQMRDGVERGETIARTAAASGLFPPMVLQMISVGEETGSVDRLMDEVAGYYEREVDYDIKNLSQAIEPLLLVVVGVMVLVMALGIFLPMWDLASVARPR
ncbi:MAG: type II secretion system F family protein [Gammaproteobacteria bacterium]|nr:type II secretion system F family protein [Gammaproteobacteria bacterium]